MPATKTTKFFTVTDNYLLLQNNDADTCIIINKLTPPADVYEGYELRVAIDTTNFGGGIFLKNKYDGDPYGNLKLTCWAREVSGEDYLFSKRTVDAGTGLSKNVTGHIVNALIAIRDGDNTARNSAISAAEAAHVNSEAVAYQLLASSGTYPFAYGIGNTTDFNNGDGVRDSQDSVNFYSYLYFQHNFIIDLIWDGSFWLQRSPLGLIGA